MLLLVVLILNDYVFLKKLELSGFTYDDIISRIAGYRGCANSIPDGDYRKYSIHVSHNCLCNIR